ncbi:ABC transporter permease [Georgenia yuyongxinii]|nr:ABC transporter permease [Georgenia yuyongxinii]
MRQLWTMTAADLRLRVRDKSVFIFAIVVPLGLMFVLNLTFGSTQNLELEPVTVAAHAEPDDQLGQVLLGVLDQLEVLDVTIEEVPAADVHDLVDRGDAQLGVVVPAGFSDSFTTGAGGAVVDITEGEGSGIEIDILYAVLQGTIDQFTAGAQAAAAGAQLGLAPDQLGQIAQQAAGPGTTLTMTQGEASSEQLSVGGALVAGQAGLFLLFTVGFGVLSLVAEREFGTLARLRSMPMRAGTIVAAKGLVSFILGIVATSVLLTVGSLFFDVDFGSPLAVAVLVVSVVVAGTSLMFIVARLAKTAEQANILQSIIAFVLGMAGGAFFPIAATGTVGHVLDLNPVAAFTRGLGITTGGGGVADLGVPVVTMLGFAVVCLAVSRLVPDRGRNL